MHGPTVELIKNMSLGHVEQVGSLLQRHVAPHRLAGHALFKIGIKFLHGRSEQQDSESLAPSGVFQGGGGMPLPDFPSHRHAHGHTTQDSCTHIACAPEGSR